MEEPRSAKRPRSDPEELYHGLRYKSISLDLEKYGEWVRKLSDDQLLSVFELGVKVREAVFFTVDVNRDFMEKALSSQMKPVQEAVATVEEEVKHQVQVVQESVSRDVRDQMNKMSDVVQEFKVNLRNDINNALDPKMKLIQGTMDTITGQVNQQVLKVQANVTNGVCDHMKKMADSVQDFKGDLRNDILGIQQALITQVEDVASKVSPLKILNESITQSAQVVLNQLNAQINSSEQRLLNSMQPAISTCQQQLSKISSSLEVKSSVKGLVGEKLVINILKQRFTNFAIVDVSRQNGKGDILIESSRQHKIMIEVKNRESSNVPQTEIDRFKSDLTSCGDVKVGILFSMKSGIANKASNGKFQVKFSQNQYQIYVPNAGKDENLIVWSVLMADELAEASHGELRRGQVEELEQLCDEFISSKEQEKRCRSSLETLEQSAKAVKESMNCILQTVDKTRKKLKKLLRPDGRDIITVN